MLPLRGQADTWQTTQGPWQIGVRAGANLTQAYISDPFRFVPINTRPLIARHGALILIRHLNAYASLQLDLRYTEKGYRQRFEGKAEQLRVRMSYLEVPVLTRLSYPFRAYRVFAHAGVFFEQLLFWKEDVPPLEADEVAHLFREGTDRKQGYGLTGMIGLGRRLGANTLSLEAGASFSLRDYLYSDRLRSEEIPFESKHFAWMVSLSYLFSLGKAQP